MHSEKPQSGLPSPGIAGIGVDTVDIARFESQLARTPKLVERLFTEAERELPAASLAARFAAKEALIKALGGSDGVNWHDMEVLRVPGEPPRFTVTAQLQALLGSRHLSWPHVSLTHDGGIATAFVVIEFAKGESE